MDTRRPAIPPASWLERKRAHAPTHDRRCPRTAAADPGWCVRSPRIACHRPSRASGKISVTRGEADDPQHPGEWRVSLQVHSADGSTFTVKRGDGHHRKTLAAGKRPYAFRACVCRQHEPRLCSGLAALPRAVEKRGIQRRHHVTRSVLVTGRRPLKLPMSRPPLVSGSDPLTRPSALSAPRDAKQKAAP
jgi:hypothetical protein